MIKDARLTPPHAYTLAEVRSIHDLPIPDLVFRAQLVHREHHPAADVQLCSLLSVKTGGCPENCGYCAQSQHFSTGVTASKQMEAGAVKDEFNLKMFFSDFLLKNVMEGYFCDPMHGGNKDMAAWKMIGYPGARADYTDWVEVRSRAYPLPPVDIAGKRG